MYPHRIRLRGPWECLPISFGTGAPAARRVNMPARWADAGLSGFRGAAHFTRKFGYPGHADPDLEHIWLTCAGCTGCRVVRLNGQLLYQICEPDALAREAASPLASASISDNAAQSPGESFAFDVTRILGARNQLDVLIQADADDAGLWGEVALEIRKSAYLSEIRAEQMGSTLRITGKVVGIAPQPLELYTLVDRRHMDYRTIAPSAAGTPFCIDLANPSTSENVRVELINVSEIWYVVETPIIKEPRTE